VCCSKTFRRMIAECLRKEPEKRPTAKQLLKHEFFKKCKVLYIIYMDVYMWPNVDTLMRF